MDINKINILGSGTALFILIICSLIFIFRIFGRPAIEYRLGILFLLTAIPLIFLIITGNRFQRPVIYYVQISTMILFIVVELILDYILKIDFRNNNWMSVTYIMLFFAGTGGMIGIASLSGKIWVGMAIVIYLIMTLLTFLQHFITGM